MNASSERGAKSAKARSRASCQAHAREGEGTSKGGGEIFSSGVMSREEGEHGTEHLNLRAKAVPPNSSHSAEKRVKGRLERATGGMPNKANKTGA